jgi:hypothetical protein
MALLAAAHGQRRRAGFGADCGVALRNLSRMDFQSNELFSWCSQTADSSDSRPARAAPWVRTNISLSTFAIPRK